MRAAFFVVPNHELLPTENEESRQNLLLRRPLRIRTCSLR
jgi:hypothetical protein